MPLVRVPIALRAAFIICPILSGHPAIGIVMDSAGSVFYSDNAHVWQITPDGKKTIAVRNVHTHELWLDSKGNLYGEHLWYEGERTDRWGHRVWKRSHDGKVADILPARAGFLGDYKDFFFVRDRQERMYWVEPDSNGLTVKRRGRGPPETMARLPGVRTSWIAAAPDGDVLLSDHGRLLRVNSKGESRTLATGFASVMGVWTEPAGNVYAAASGSREVKRVSPSGQVSTAAVSPFPWRPSGGLVAADGALWVLEFSPLNAQRVRRIDPAGISRGY